MMSKQLEVWHPLLPNDAVVRSELRALLAPRKGAMRGPAARSAYDAFMQQVSPATDVSYRPAEIRGVSGWWCTPSNVNADGIILYLHGGWFVLGSASAYRNFVGHIAARARTATFIPDYRLAPEHPLPAAIDDVRAVYDGLTEAGWRRIGVAGDSAGGALVLELLVSLARQPGAVCLTAGVLLSPVTDLTLSGATWVSRNQADLVFTKDQVQEVVSLYLGGADAANGLASPMNLDLHGLPPLRLHAGDDEMLLDDSRRFARLAHAAGVDVRLDVWEGMQHVFPAALDKFEASRSALDAVAVFLVEQLSPEKLPIRDA
jgi:monoterpene epsilon-lactone hydrolase